MIQPIKQVERLGYSRYDVFNDWVDLMLTSLEGDDDAYREIVDRYDNDQPVGERPIDRYSEAFGALQHGMAETDADLLGVLYEELGMESDAFGQYFTPHPVCELKAELAIDGVDDQPYRIADPASGSGRLLIHAARAIPDGADAMFYGQDKDSTCAKMTALNMYLFNMDGYATHGDSLQMETHRVWEVTGSSFGGRIHELPDDEFPSIDHDALAASMEGGETEDELVTFTDALHD